jgi:hypothetical protein
VQERKVQDVEFRALEIEKDYEDAKQVRDEFKKNYEEILQQFD